MTAAVASQGAPDCRAPNRSANSARPEVFSKMDLPGDFADEFA
jgi:hypothetical protein